MTMPIERLPKSVDAWQMVATYDPQTDRVLFALWNQHFGDDPPFMEEPNQWMVRREGQTIHVEAGVWFSPSGHFSISITTMDADVAVRMAEKAARWYTQESGEV